MERISLLRPLVELLRIRHCPLRHGFGLRYLRRDVGAGTAERVAWQSYAGSLEELRARVDEAEEWVRELLAEVGAQELPL